MDFNIVLDEISDLIADKLIRRLRQDQLRGDWPRTETKEEVSLEPADDTIVDAEPLPAPKVANSPTDNRSSLLGKVNIRTLRNRLVAVEEKDAGHYDHLSKPDLVNEIVKLETLLGRTLEDEIDRRLKEQGLKIDDEDDVQDDTDFSEPEPADDTDPGIVTREDAERLSLREVKALALRNSVSETALTGLDIDAVVDLIYGPKAADEAPVVSEDASDEGDLELDEDEINKMSIGELKELIDKLNKQYELGIEYTRDDDREKLIELIFDNLEEEDNE